MPNRWRRSARWQRRTVPAATRGQAEIRARAGSIAAATEAIATPECGARSRWRTFRLHEIEEPACWVSLERGCASPMASLYYYKMELCAADTRRGPSQ